MKQVKLLFLVGLSLISTVMLPMNIGGRLAARVGKLGVEFAGRAKTVAQNVRANPFPTYCKVVSAGIGAYYCGQKVPGIVKEIWTKQYTPEGYLNAVSTYAPKASEQVYAHKANELVTAFVRSHINLPNAQAIQVLIMKVNEKGEKKLEAMKESQKLTCASALIEIPINCAAVYDHTILVNAPTSILLSSPRAFCNESEYKEFCKVVAAVIEHESGHLKKNHVMQSLIIGPMVAPFIVGAAGKRMGPVAKQLLRMRPQAKTKEGMLARSIVGGSLKCGTTAVGLTALQRQYEYEADNNVSSEHREMLSKCFFYNVSSI